MMDGTLDYGTRQQQAFGVERHGNTTFINAASCTLLYEAKHQAVVFDLKVNGPR